MAKLLEDRLGVALFQRQANRLELTPAVRAYQGVLRLPRLDCDCGARVTSQAGDG
jgi:LysR family glycine cleavage system transcriptional activator